MNRRLLSTGYDELAPDLVDNHDAIKFLLLPAAALPRFWCGVPSCPNRLCRELRKTTSCDFWSPARWMHRITTVEPRIGRPSVPKNAPKFLQCNYVDQIGSTVIYSSVACGSS